MALALLPFLNFLNEDVPHRAAAVKILEDSLPRELLEEDAAWVQAWKASGIDQEVHMPRYFRQLDLPHGARMCFTSAAAMVASFHKELAPRAIQSALREVRRYNFCRRSRQSTDQPWPDCHVYSDSRRRRRDGSDRLRHSCNSWLATQGQHAAG